MIKNSTFPLPLHENIDAIKHDKKYYNMQGSIIPKNFFKKLITNIKIYIFKNLSRFHETNVPYI